MGFCYEGRKLCCDICGKAGARKYRCPFGWCQATAACPECRKNRPELFGKAFHRSQGCEKYHNDFVAEHKDRADLIAAGRFCLRAALGITLYGKETVHVLFEGKDKCIGKYIPPEIYQQRKTYNDTPEYFEGLAGFPLPDAPDDFHKAG